MEYMKKAKVDFKGVNILCIGLWFEISAIRLSEGKENITR